MGRKSVNRLKPTLSSVHWEINASRFSKWEICQSTLRRAKSGNGSLTQVILCVINTVLLITDMCMSLIWYHIYLLEYYWILFYLMEEYDRYKGQ